MSMIFTDPDNAKWFGCIPLQERLIVRDELYTFCSPRFHRCHRSPFYSIRRNIERRRAHKKIGREKLDAMCSVWEAGRMH